MSIMTQISHIISKGDIIGDTQKVMRLAKWKEYIKGKKIILKVNYMSDQVIPSLCTSPWVLEGVLKELSQLDAVITLVDSDLATSHQLERALHKWGVLELCQKYGTKFVNLTYEDTETIETSIPDKVETIDIPKILLEAECIVTLPVAKTHYLTRLTCSLKNQWGAIPRIRQQYHPIADDLIPEINRLLKVKFAVVDATICMEGNGPRTGIPKAINSIFASNDLVALDKCIQTTMGLDGKIGHIENASRMIEGSSLTYEIFGDRIVKHSFIPASTTIITKLELFCRKIPGLRFFLFKTPIFLIPAWFATKYNTWWYFNKKGKKLAKIFLEKNPQYREEFQILLDF